VQPVLANYTLLTQAIRQEMTSVYADLDGQIVRRFPNTSNYAHSPSGWKRRVDCGNDDKYVSVEKPFANHGAKMGFL
jgi:hypothetical protein